MRAASALEKDLKFKSFRYTADKLAIAIETAKIFELPVCFALNRNWKYIVILDQKIRSWNFLGLFRS